MNEVSDTPYCRLTGEALEKVLDLGRQPLGNGFQESELGAEYFYDLQCGFAPNAKLFQLIFQPDPNLMFHDNYAFRSGTSRSMQEHFAALASRLVTSEFLRGPNPKIVEIGCNDGVFLRNFRESGVQPLGVEPSSVAAEEAISQGIDVDGRFFSAQVGFELADSQGRADVVYAANVFCHIPDLPDLVEGIDNLLKPEGVIIFEDPYLGDVIQKCSYDQIYDEHVFLFSAMSVSNIFSGAGFELIDAEPLQTHGGSMRYYLGRRKHWTPRPSVEAVLKRERAQQLDSLDTYFEFASRVSDSANNLKCAMEDIASQGLRIAAYGATSKSTTVFNYVGLGPDIVEYVCDNSPGKIGKFSPGMHIPIVPEEFFTSNPPNVAFLSAWNHQIEIRRNNKDFERYGGRWLTHVPKVQLLE